MKAAVEMIEAIRYKLRIFGVPLDGPASVFFNNEALYQDTTVPKSTLSKKHHSIAYHCCRETSAAGIAQISKEGTLTNLSNLSTKLLMIARRDALLEGFTY